MTEVGGLKSDLILRPELWHDSTSDMRSLRESTRRFMLDSLNDGMGIISLCKSEDARVEHA